MILLNRNKNLIIKSFNNKCNFINKNDSIISKRRYSTLNNNDSKSVYDIVIVGGGIVGTATARELLMRNPKLKLCILEGENALGQQQSSHNSGVVHVGIYYKPGSTRARLCVRGARMMIDYCEKNNLPFEKCGKIIVASKSDQFKDLDALYQRGIENGVEGLRMLESEEEIKKIEPYITGLRAIYSPNTAIADFGVVTLHMGKEVEALGGEIKLNFNATKFNYDESTKLVEITSDNNSTSSAKVFAKFLITCCGMYSDRVATISYGQKEPAIVPFRGTFLKLKKEHEHMIKGNVYPLPNPAFPFLGVHYTKRTNGEIWLGPNAVFATSRQGYRYRDINIKDFFEAILHPGFLKLSIKHFRYGLGEFIRDVFPSSFIEHLLPFTPTLTVDQLEYGGSGVRAQGIGYDGNLVEDFVFDLPPNKPILHVRNSPSPSATSSLAIAEEVADMAKANYPHLL